MIFDDSSDRSSEDHQDTVKYISHLISDGKLTINDVLIFFNYACGAYRQASSIIKLSESKINIEFNYAARAFASYISCNSRKDQQGEQLALLDAFQASRHIVNDALDLILYQLTNLIEESKDISDSTRLHHLIDNYTKKIEEKNKIHEIVAQSRRLRGTFRYEKYLEIINGETYTKLLSFLKEVTDKIEELLIERDKEQRKNRRYLALTWGLFIIGLFSTVAIGLFPDEAKSVGAYIKELLGITKSIPKIP